MRKKKQNLSYPRKRLVWHFAAYLLMFYLIADVSVLEYFCGNPELGIVSYSQVVKKVSAKSKDFKCDTVKSSPEFPKQDDDSDIQLDGDDCFCCCSFALQNFFVIIYRLPHIEKHLQNSYIRAMQSNPHLSLNYRPPRFT